MKKILTIIGPTASGKTAISVAMAKQIGGEIVSLDSRQIYKGMSIGTAQPSLEEKGGIPHHLIGIQNPDTEVAAGHYAEMVIKVVADIQKRKKIPIICGGAGLYYRAITKGIFEGSFSDASIRKKLEKEYDIHGGDIMLERLEEIDPEYAENLSMVFINSSRNALCNLISILRYTSWPLLIVLFRPLSIPASPFPSISTYPTTCDEILPYG